MRTYGRLWFDEKSKNWIVKAEPHITIRMKRVFERISKTEFGQVTLADSDETRRELDWFLQRYNLEVADKDWTRILDGTERYKEEILTLEKIIDPNWKPRREVKMALPPRQYQLQAAEVLLERKFLLLGDDLGLGKTVATITCFTEPRTLPAVVVTLAGVLPQQWQEEVNRFMPSLFTHIIKKRALYELPKRDGRGPDVLIINYAKLDSWAEVLAKYVNCTTFDEAQELRHKGTAKYDAAVHVARHSKYALGLSVGPDSMVLVNGKLGIQYLTIKEFSEQAKAVEGKFTGVSGYKVRAFDGNKFCWKKLRAVLKHRPGKKKTFRIHTEKGRSLLLTEDHSIYKVVPEKWVYIGSKKKGVLRIEEAKGKDLKVGDHVLLEDAVDVEKPFEVFHVSDLITASRWYVAGDFKPWINENVRGENGVKQSWLVRHRQKTIGRYGPYVTGQQFMSSKLLQKLGGKIYTQGRGYNWTMSRIPAEDLSYILGFFAGDGWVSESRLCFAVENARVKDFRRRLRRLKKWAAFNVFTRKMKGKSVEMRFTSLILANFFRGLYRAARAWEKRIPEEVFSFSKKNVREFIQGMIDSDGYVHIRDKKKAVFYSTTSRDLAYGLVELLKRVNVIAGISMRKARGSGGFVRGRRIIGKRDIYTVFFSFYEWVGDNGGRHGRRERFKSEGVSGFPVRIKKITKEKTDFVYDLSVAGAKWQTFVASGILVHNSGTPIFNYGGEIYNVLNVLKDGALGKYDEFFREWCTSAYGEKKISVRDPKALGTYLRENFLMLRRTRKDVGRELPPLSKIPHTVSVDMKALDNVKDSAFALAKLIASEQKLSGFEKMKASEELSHMLRQATGIAKSPYCADFVRMLVEEGSSVVVYAWHRAVYDVMAKKLEDLNPVMITGAESTKEKIASKKKFISGESKVLMISLRAGAGIDGLQKVSNTVVFAELDWSPGAMEQCLGRVFRDGQPQPVTAFYLVTEEGSDPTMSQALGLKTEQIEGLRNPDKELVETLQVDEERIRTLAKNYLAKNRAKMEADGEEEEEPQEAESET